MRTRLAAQAYGLGTNGRRPLECGELQRLAQRADQVGEMGLMVDVTMGQDQSQQAPPPARPSTEDVC